MIIEIICLFEGYIIYCSKLFHVSYSMGTFLTNDDEEGSNCLETEVALATDVALPSLLQGFYFKY